MRLQNKECKTKWRKTVLDIGKKCFQLGSNRMIKQFIQVAQEMQIINGILVLASGTLLKI